MRIIGVLAALVTFAGSIAGFQIATAAPAGDAEVRSAPVAVTVDDRLHADCPRDGSWKDA